MTKRYITYLLILFVSISAIDFLLQYELQRQYKKDQILDVSLRLSAFRANLEKEVTANLLLVQGTANFISVNPDLPPEVFSLYAQRVLEGADLLKNIGAAPDYVMKYVYPLKGNEAILGVNYKDIPNQWEQVQKATLTEEMVIAGPLKLIQGGIGLIGRAPVFVYGNNQKQFWGIVSSVMDVDRLYDKVKLDNQPFEIAIRGVDGRGADGRVFKGRSELFAQKEEAVTMSVSFPSGSWLLAGKPKQGWAQSHPNGPYVHIFLGTLFLALAFFIYRAEKRSALIEQSRKNLSISQAMAHLGSWELNHESNMLWWSDEVYRIFGLSPEEVTPTLELFLSMVHPEDQASVEAEFSKSLNSCGSYAVDHRIIRRDGGVRHVQERGSIQCNRHGNATLSRGTILDITERVLAEQQSKANAEQLRAMSEASNDALIMIDSDDKIMFWSLTAEKMFGWSRDEVLGQKLHHLLAQKDDRDSALKSMKHFAATGRGASIGSVSEFMAVKRDGSLIPIERSVAAFTLGDQYYAVGTLRDISERKKAEQELRTYSDRLGLASKAGQIGVWEWRVEDNSLMWDDQMFKLYAVEKNEFTGLFEAWKSRVHPDDYEKAEQSLMAAMDGKTTWEWEFRIIWPNGEIRHIKAAALTRTNEEAQATHMTGVNWDVTESKRTQEQLRLLATTDSLTGLNNRRHFMELVDHEIERSIRYKSSFSLIMFDVDKFKSVNDTYGHDIGDLVLQAIAKTADANLRDSDILGRVGGEEFAIGLPETSLEEAIKVAEKLRASIEHGKAPLPDGREIDFTISLGVSEYSTESGSLQGLMKAADTALYMAKKNGRNRVESAFVEPAQE